MTMSVDYPGYRPGLNAPATDPDLLFRLVAAARDYKMSPQEVFAQRVSFVYGQMNGKVTKEQVRAVLLRSEGFDPDTSDRRTMPREAPC